MIDNPDLIEKKSFDIIGSELEYKVKEENIPTIFRIIHTTADFDYARITEIHPDAVSAGIEAIKKGCRIYADTNMIQAGVNKDRLAKTGSEIYTMIADEAVQREAKERMITRSIVGMEKACSDTATRIFVIGNAPTALVTLKKLIDAGETRPALIIGVPVGFVGAAESKEEIKKSRVPYIVTNGRKGGSTVAVAILNSLIYRIG